MNTIIFSQQDPDQGSFGRICVFLKVYLEIRFSVQKLHLRNLPALKDIGGAVDGCTCIVTGPTRCDTLWRRLLFWGTHACMMLLIYISDAHTIFVAVASEGRQRQPLSEEMPTVAPSRVAHVACNCHT